MSTRTTTTRAATTAGPTSTMTASTGWLDILGGIGAIAIPATLLYSFFTSDDGYENTAEGVIGYAESHPADLWTQQVTALVTPLLIGFFLAALLTRLRSAPDAYRALTAIGGTLFIVFMATGMTLWAAPLLASDDLTTASAEAYLGYDDAGWVLLALSGVSIGVMIIGASLGAALLGLVPRWAGWVGIALGVISLATVVAVGIFAWTLWLVVAGCWLLVTRSRQRAA